MKRLLRLWVETFHVLFPFGSYIYRPQTKFAKVMFLHLSVILFTGGGLPQCMLGYHPPEQTPHPRSRHPPGTRHPPPPPGTRHPPPPPGTRHPPEPGTPPGTRHPPGPGTPPREQKPPWEQTPPGTRHPPPPEQRRLLLRTVRILLECILVETVVETFHVLFTFGSYICSICLTTHSMSWIVGIQQ